MTIEQLCQCSADELEKMSDAELLEHFKPMLDVCRPERQTAQVRAINKSVAHNPKLMQGLELLKGMGVEVGDSLIRYKKGKK